MKILVCGGAGYIGAHMCKALAAEGYEPVVFDNLSSGHRHAVKWGPLVVGDIRDRRALDDCFAAHRPAAVIQFAASIEVGEGEANPLKFWNNNVGGTVTLLEAMAGAGVTALVFSSTCATYGIPERMPIGESEPQRPFSVYGETKLAVEKALAATAKISPLRYASLRYFNAAGASPDGEIGEEHDPETHLIPNALKAAAGIGSAMKLFGTDYDTPDGTCVRDYIHVMDLAAAHLAALRLLLDGADSFVCNLGTGTGLTVREILSTVEAVTGRPVPVEESPRRPGDVPRLVADPSFAQEHLGFFPQYSDVGTVIRDAWNFHKTRWSLAP